jgi:hypothetical protein
VPTTYVDRSAAPGVTYAYFVVALFAGEQRSGISNFATIETPAPTVIDFEEFTGRSSGFSTADPPLTIGVATISGGQIIGASTSNLPANTTIIYGTASFCDRCSPTITMNFSQPVSNFSLLLMNGATVTVEYRVQDNQEGSQTVTLPSNSESGAQTITLPSEGITQVLITPTVASEFWDFFIDNVQFTVMR